jgi:hypothetical protein
LERLVTKVPSVAAERGQEREAYRRRNRERERGRETDKRPWQRDRDKGEGEVSDEGWKYNLPSNCNHRPEEVRLNLVGILHSELAVPS